jgi:hypothetical protein
MPIRIWGFANLHEAHLCRHINLARLFVCTSHHPTVPKKGATMKRILFFVVLLTATVMFSACSTDPAVAPEPPSVNSANVINQEQVAADIIHLAGWIVEDAEDLPQSDPEKCFEFIRSFERTEVAPNIAHYRWEIQVGTNDMDVIALHRVVKERQPERPIRARNAIFLQHGDAKDFVGMFLPGTLSATTPDEFGAAVYWAERNMDVWGIDQAWNLVPAETEDFDFMAEWGITKQANDLGTAVTLARLARRATGNGYRKMILLGYSSGSATGYALINAETQLPAGHRQVGGWIPVDYSPVSDDENWNEIAQCMPIADLQNMMDTGEYGYFVGFDFLGNLAHDDPDGPSPVFPGFTNMQAAMFLGSGPIFGVDNVHYLAGIWEDEMPVDFVHVTVDQWLDFMIAGSPWQPTLQLLDYSNWGCMETDVPWDQHFGEITIPVLNFGAAGGAAPTTGYCLTLLGSDDITDVSIQLLPDDEAALDFGHIDLWIADVAPELVWDPILDWVRDHTPGGNAHGRPHSH